MAGRDLIVIGTSAGGVPVLRELVAGLPAGLPAAVLIVCHLSPLMPSRLPEILSAGGRLLARAARDGEPIYPGQIYVAPPDHHLLVQPGRLQLSRGPRENRLRPAIDPLFRTAARAYGPRVIGVILSGAMNDGVAGLMAVRAGGGVAVVQDAQDALVSALPRQAQALAGADYVVPAARLAPLFDELVRGPAGPGSTPMTDPIEKMPAIVNHDMQAQEQGQRTGQVSVFTCPECGGSLWQVDQSGLVRFRCHVGHAYHAEVLLEEQSAALEAALWTAIRTFREKAVLARQLAAYEQGRGNTAAAERFAEEARLAEHYGVLIEQHVLHAPKSPPVPDVTAGDGPPAPAPAAP